MPLSGDAAPLGVPEFDLADRLRKSLRESGIGVQEMADYLEVERGTVSTWINGRIKPSAQTIRLFAMRTGVNHKWLKEGIVASGDGPNGGEEDDVRRRGVGPRTRCLRGIAAVIGIRRQKKPDILPQYDDRTPYTRPIAA